MGSTQTEHIIPILEKDYTMVDVGSCIKGRKSKWMKLLQWTWAILRVDAIYNIYTSENAWMYFFWAKLLGKRVITHWIGTDVYYIMGNPKGAKRISKFVDVQFSCFEPLRDELLQVGIDTKVLPIIPIKINYELCEMPKKHSVMIYMPNGREDFYGYQELKNIFPAFSQLTFHIVGTDHHAPFAQFQNVAVEGFLSHAQMEALFREISIVIRPTKHDGLSMSVLEAMAKGKNVIWSSRFPHTMLGRTEDEIKKCLQELIDTSPKQNTDAHDYVVENYNAEAFFKGFQTGIGDMWHDTNT